MTDERSGPQDDSPPLGTNEQPTTVGVSVIIPAYNAADFITAALDSIFSQTFNDYEVIVINDGSPDTTQLEQALAPYLARIIYLKQENRGAAAARNAGLRIARGRFVAFLDADDFWLPDYLSEQIRFLETSGADMVYADAMLIGSLSQTGRTYMKLTPSRGKVTPVSLLRATSNVITSGVLARAASIIEVGMFAEDIKRGHDFDLWLRLAKKGARIDFQRKVLLRHRALDSSLSGDLVSRHERTLKVLETIKKRHQLTASEQAALDWSAKRGAAALNVELGKDMLLQKDFGGAAKAFQEANRFYRSWKLRTVLLGLRLAPHFLWRVYFRTKLS